MPYFATRAFLQLLRRHPPTASRDPLWIPLISRCWFLCLLRMNRNGRTLHCFRQERQWSPALAAATTTRRYQSRKTNEPGLAGRELLRISRTKGFVRWHQKIQARRVVVAGDRWWSQLPSIDSNIRNARARRSSDGIGNRNWRSSRTG